MAEASRRYMEEQFGETENEYRLSGAVLRLYVAYTHAVATLSRRPDFALRSFDLRLIRYGDACPIATELVLRAVG